MAIKIVCVLIILIAEITYGYKYNRLNKFKNITNPYPDTCCQLEFRDTVDCAHLNQHYVSAGKWYERNWGYAVKSEGDVGAKSENPCDKPYWFTCSQVFSFPRCKPRERYSILTNPNNCTLKYYRTRFHGERLPLNKDWHFPVVSAQGKLIGDFAKRNGEVVKVKPEESMLYDLLYVDCKESLRAMSTSKLLNITYKQEDIEKLKSRSHQSVYKKEVMTNDSPSPSESVIEFEQESFENVTIHLATKHSSFFNTDVKSYQEYSVTAAAGLTSALGINEGSVSANFQATLHNERSVSAGTNGEENQEIFRASAKRDVFRYRRTITTPPFSETTFTAYTSPIRGVIPAVVVYELTPTGSKESNTAENLVTSLRYYGMENKIQITQNKTLLISFDSFVDLDVGHDIVVELTTAELDSHGKKQEDYPITESLLAV